MTKEQIHQLFKQGYSQANWKQFLGKTFPKARLLATPETLIGIDTNVAIKALKLGYVSLDENGIERQIAVYEVALAKGIILERNRVGLRNLLRKYWKDIDAAFIVYHNSENNKWRFTYVSELTGYDDAGNFQKIQTEPKRYTYVLGEGESTRTAAERFILLGQKANKATLDDVKDAFSVEKLSDAFFHEYKYTHYSSYVEALLGEKIEKKEKKDVWVATGKRSSFFTNVFLPDKTEDQAKIDTRNFVKKLLGRIVFLYFIQKKGWLGVPVSSKWGQGDFNFLTNLFKQHKNPDLFYSEMLTRLFFDTLNTKRKDDIIELVKGQPCRIPYLNGGLFEEDDKKQRNIILNAQLFRNLFDFFNQYNFTIYEDDPNDHTVAVDPEMLGHIFENLLEDNKDKGTFYTPKEIVHYMCQESLIEYLTTWFESKGYEVTSYIGFDKPDQPRLFSANEGNKGQLVLETEPQSKGKQIDRLLIEKLLKKKIEDSDKKLVKQHATEFHAALDNVKICDPAIGSGAFPMGLLQEIFTVKQTLWHFEHGNLKDFPASDVKLNIIQNSIYGVDIEKGAVDIARLRFWLSLVVDEEFPKPLPNLDYKIVVGNSLVSKLDGDIIDIDWDIKEEKAFQANIFGSGDLNENKVKLLKNISKEQKEFFTPTSDKKKLAVDIRKLKIDLLINQLELMVTTKGIETKPSDTGKKLIAQTEQRHLQTLNWKESIKQLKKLKDQPDKPLNFFDWKLDFPEVLNELINPNVGFDIMIGNPPYVDYRLIETAITGHKNYPINRASSRPNLYQYFIELGDCLINSAGTFCFINPNQFLSTDNGLQIREHLILNRSIKFVIDVSYLKIFEEASTYTIVWLFNKKGFKENEIRINRCSDIKNLSLTSFRIKQKLINESTSKIIPINLEYFALSKIESGKKTLNDIAKLKWGTSAAGYGRKKISDVVYNELPASRKTLYAPILQTSDTKKYYIEWQGEYIPTSIYSEAIIREFKKDKIVIGRLTKSIQACIDLEHCFVGKATVITDCKLDLRILLAILNSVFANRWYFLKFETTHMAGGYLRFDIPYLEKLPIPDLTNNISQIIIKIVDKIISQKSQGADTFALEQQIDHLVYRLYELSFDEVKVIDPEFSLSKMEYDRLQLE